MWCKYFHCAKQTFFFNEPVCVRVCVCARMCAVLWMCPSTVSLSVYVRQESCWLGQIFASSLPVLYLLLTVDCVIYMYEDRAMP